MNSFHKVADLIDAIANSWERSQERAAEPKQAAASTPEGLSEVYENVFGTPPSPEVLAKLANDPAMSETFYKLAERATRPDSLGGPGDLPDSPSEPQNKIERLKAAEQRFANWLVD